MMRPLLIALLLVALPWKVEGQEPWSHPVYRPVVMVDSASLITVTDVRRMIDSALAERDGTAGAGVVIETLYVTPEGWWIHRPPRPDSCLTVDTAWLIKPPVTIELIIDTTWGPCE